MHANEVICFLSTETFTHTHAAPLQCYQIVLTLPLSLPADDAFWSNCWHFNKLLLPMAHRFNFCNFKSSTIPNANIKYNAMKFRNHFNLHKLMHSLNNLRNVNLMPAIRECQPTNNYLNLWCKIYLGIFWFCFYTIIIDSSYQNWLPPVSN